MKTKLTLLLIVAVFGSGQPALTQKGTLDSTFGVNGKVLTAIGQYFYGGSVAIQRDGKIVVAGASDNHLAMMRCLQNGIIDSSFGLNGIVDDLGTGGSGAALQIQPDGKLVAVAGYNTLARYLKDGRPDSTFGVNGKVSNGVGAVSVAIQKDKKIVVGGSMDARFALMQYNPDGTTDSSFGSNGIAVAQFNRGAGISSLAIQADGKIVAAGQGWGHGRHDKRLEFFSLARFKRDGKRDQTFGDNGKLQTSFVDHESIARGVVIQSDGQIVAAGIDFQNHRGVVRRSNFALAQYKPDGTLHNTFGEEGNGRVITDFHHIDIAYSIALLPSRKIIVVGSSNGDFALARYSGNGVPDSTFGNRNNGNKMFLDFGGDDNAYSVAVQEDGKIVVVGTSDGRLAIARYNSDKTNLTDNSNDDIANLRKADNIPSSNIYLYPDPVKDVFRVKGLSSSKKIITVIDGEGRTLQKTTAEGSDHTFNVKQLRPGIYYVRIDEGEKATLLKFIKE